MLSTLQPQTTPYGVITREPSTAGQVGLTHLDKATLVENICWRPPADCEGDVPADYALEMVAFADGEGNVRIAPRHGFKTFIVKACIGGLAVLKFRGLLSPEEVFSCRAMSLVYQWQYQRRCRLKRQFSSKADLIIKPSGRHWVWVVEPGSQSGNGAGTASRRQPVGAAHVLPEQLGVASNAQGREWSIEQLFQYGRAAANNAGIANPKTTDIIAYGLMAAALRNPLPAEVERVPALVRNALFAMPDAKSPSADIKEETVKRLCHAIQEHQADSQVHFDAWCCGKHNNLPKSLANRRTCSSGPLSIEAVNRVLADLGWEAHQHVAMCVQAAMRWFENCLKSEWTSETCRLFEQIYLPRAYFGHLPLVMLLDRASIIKPLVLRLWEQPDNSQLIGAFHQVLSYYQQMVENRRSADRRVKQFKQARSPQQSAATDTHQLLVTEEIHPHVCSIKTAICARAKQIARQDGVCCHECQGELLFSIDNDAYEPQQPLNVVGSCPHHPSSERSIEIPWDEMIAVVAQQSAVVRSADRVD